MYDILGQINSPDDVKKLNSAELTSLAKELRQFMIEHVSKTGGHLAPSLGVVELVLALCRVFDFPRDRLIFDVGHQCYAYKILTGRRDEFATLRQTDGISGFPKSEESEYDAFNTGHSSTSISAGYGMAVARDLQGEDYHVISIIGDGALTGGMAFEALNNAGSSGKNFIVILNDNAMSISQNVGAIADYLSRFRTAPQYERRKRAAERFFNRSSFGQRIFGRLRRIKDSLKYLVVQGVIFEEFGFTYLGPIDGHNIDMMQSYLKIAKNLNGPVLLHVHTKKGRGYLPSETDPDRFHGIAPFDPESGKLVQKGPKKLTFSQSFGDTLLEMASSDEKICAITAAMPSGTGLCPFADTFPNRFFDVGIAEQHGVTFAAGLAKAGMHPVVAIYSSFLQRGFDQVFHDVCLQSLPVILGVDRAGIVGEDGETHQGIYDIAYLRILPNMTLMAPSTHNEMVNMLRFAKELNAPCALRYPRGNVLEWDKELDLPPLVLGRGVFIYEGKDVMLVPLGTMMEEALKVREFLEERGISTGVFNPRFVKPLDHDALRHIAISYNLVVTMEDHVINGGFGSAVGEYYHEQEIDSDLLSIALPDHPVKQGKREEIFKKYQMDAESITERIVKRLEEKR